MARDHQLDFPVLVDGEGAELGKYFPVGSVPLNILVDSRIIVCEVTDGESHEQGFRGV